MFDIAAFEAAFAVWDASSGQCGCMGAQQEIIEASGLIEDVLEEVKRLRAEVTELRAKDKVRRLSDAGDRRDWDACDAIEAERPDSEAP